MSSVHDIPAPAAARPPSRTERREQNERRYNDLRNQVAAMSKPIDRVRLICAVANNALPVDLRELRKADLIELRKTMRVAQIAERVSLSAGRISQITGNLRTVTS